MEYHDIYSWLNYKEQLKKIRGINKNSRYIVHHSYHMFPEIEDKPYNNKRWIPVCFK